MPTSVVKVIELSREVVETKRNSAKLMDPTNDLAKKLNDCRAAERKACGNLKRAEGCVKMLNAHVEELGTKNMKIVEEAAQTKEGRRVWITSLESSLETNGDRVARFKKARGDENAGSQLASAEQQKARDTLSVS